MLKIFTFLFAIMFSFAAQAEGTAVVRAEETVTVQTGGGAAVQTGEKTIEISGGQASVPVGLTVLVKSITIGDGATKVQLQASFDGDTIFINMNDNGKAYLTWGEGANKRLWMRTITGNKWMQIRNGTTMEGTLIYPGVIPDEVDRIELVFNAGNSGNDTSAPGVTIPLELKK